MKTFRIGILGTENSHADAFCKLFNQPDENGNLIYPDCHVTLVYGNYPEANERLVRECGADAIAASIEEMVANVDAVMVTARDGKFHADFARPFIEAGIPAFVDKPFTTDVGEAEALVRLAREKGVPLVGGSSLKYAGGIRELKAVKEALGSAVRGGCMSAPLSMVNEYSGFWFYSSHLAEMCMEVFGWQPRAVVATEDHGSVYATVRYADYAVSCNFMDGCGDCYAGSVFAEKTTHRTIDLADIFRCECDAFVDMLHTGKMTHSYEELIAPVRLLAAVKKAYETGKTVEIKGI